MAKYLSREVIIQIRDLNQFYISDADESRNRCIIIPNNYLFGIIIHLLRVSASLKVNTSCDLSKDYCPICSCTTLQNIGLARDANVDV